MWNIAYDEMLQDEQPQGIRSIAYANDLAIIVKSKTDGEDGGRTRNEDERDGGSGPMDSEGKEAGVRRQKEAKSRANEYTEIEVGGNPRELTKRVGGREKDRRELVDQAPGTRPLGMGSPQARQDVVPHNAGIERPRVLSRVPTPLQEDSKPGVLLRARTRSYPRVPQVEVQVEGDDY